MESRVRLHLKTSVAYKNNLLLTVKILLNSQIRCSGCRVASWKNSVFRNALLHQGLPIFDTEIQVRM